MGKKGKPQPLVAATYEGEFEVHGEQYRPLANGDKLCVTLQAEWSPEEMAKIAMLAGKRCTVHFEEIIEPVLPGMGDESQGPELGEA
jgi:hypothetical protein